MPYEGQHDPKVLKTVTPKTEELVVEEEVTVKQEVAEMTTVVSSYNAERKTISEPTGKLYTNNVGIKSTLNPRIKKVTDVEEVSSDLNENYSQEQFDHAWKEYALSVKRDKKDSLFATLTTSEYGVSSDHKVTLKLKNTIQSAEIEEEKIKLVRFLRSRLRNSNVQLNYILEESQSIKVMDSKSTFDKLAEENSSLHKFRKLFNLDIEF